MDTAQCIRELFSIFNNFEDRNAFARIFNIDENTFARWQRGSFSAKGTNLIRTRIALEYLGYNLTDWRFTEAAYLPICEAVTFNIVTIRDVRIALDFSSNNDVFRQLLMGHNTSKRRRELARSFADQMWRDISRESDKARMALSSFPHLYASTNEMSEAPPQEVYMAFPVRTPRPKSHSKKYDSGFSSKVYSPEVSRPEAPAHVCQQTVTSREMLEIFGGLLNAMRPVLEYFNNADPEVRKDLRKHVGYAEISEVTELFRNVTSEKYKQEHKQSQSTQQKGQ